MSIDLSSAASSASRTQPQSIDLNAVRLCFQVFLTDDAYKVQRALPPIVSEVIYDKKAMSDLLIVRSSHCSGPVKGGTTVILLCEKVRSFPSVDHQLQPLLWTHQGWIFRPDRVELLPLISNIYFL